MVGTETYDVADTLESLTKASASLSHGTAAAGSQLMTPEADNSDDDDNKQEAPMGQAPASAVATSADGDAAAAAASSRRAGLGEGGEHVAPRSRRVWC
mmetsp:Transcript_22211/g.48560  ORF Transcript_22211/g.48560 Transcript_22211/m.48560 type:complete len:98 (-) Transcript_22211:66-359(-)